MDKLQGALYSFYNKAKEIWGSSLLKWDVPTLRFKVKGKTAAYAYYEANMIDLNLMMYQKSEKNSEEFCNHLIGHEIAHLIAFQLYGLDRLKGNDHGPEWKEIMRALGLDPKRTHTMDICGLSKKRVNKRIEFKCGCNDKIYQLTLQKSKFVVAAQLSCNHCNQPLIHTGNVTPVISS